MKDFRDDELKKFIEEQYEKETDQMEKALSSNENLEKYEETEEKLEASYNRLIERLKADGVYREEENGDSDAAYNEIIKLKKTGSTAEHGNSKSAGAEPMFRAEDRSYKSDTLGRDEKIREYRPKKSWKQKITRAAATVAVCACCVFAASMTSEANRRYVVDTVNYWAGNDTDIMIDNDEGNNKERDEEVVRTTIQEALNVEVPQFMYRPGGFKFTDYFMEKQSGIAELEYEYDGKVVQMLISKTDANAGSYNIKLHGNGVEKIKTEDNLIEIDIMTVKAEGDLEPSYTAVWKTEKAYYQLSGKIAKNKMIKILKKMKI